MLKLTLRVLGLIVGVCFLGMVLLMPDTFRDHPTGAIHASVIGLVFVIYGITGWSALDWLHRK